MNLIIFSKMKKKTIFSYDDTNKTKQYLLNSFNLQRNLVRPLQNLIEMSQFFVPKILKKKFPFIKIKFKLYIREGLITEPEYLCYPQNVENQYKNLSN
ncbi:hypothetical protein BpHYR1_044595 [Brachionus plicatilis]|uniref:Uncharacterized protein n=1 Tax=Brachionus plicatilis TaxID=10195 RepID=A0A3M7PVB2_BRAPC|nr:hypothetical protein BpHYR1_044595 [Brachionus plicatilis]